MNKNRANKKLEKSRCWQNLRLEPETGDVVLFLIKNSYVLHGLSLLSRWVHP